MKTIQLLSIEAGAECNLSGMHKQCPSAIRSRSGKPMTDDLMVEIAASAYLEFGFGGLVGWHYYNEPTLQLNRIFGLMERIRTFVPSSRFILWTNGAVASADPRMSWFEQARITNYCGDEELLRARFSCIKNVEVFNARFDNRLTSPVGKISHEPCLRPFVEIPVDNFGVAHLCCQDWPGEIKLGDFWSNTWADILARRRLVVNKISKKQMSADAPERCLRCTGRLACLPSFDARARAEALAWDAKLKD